MLLPEAFTHRSIVDVGLLDGYTQSTLHDGHLRVSYSVVHCSSQAEEAVLQGIVEKYQGSAILEVQARSCEYSHMFKLDGMRAALLEHIPPLDESTYTRNLGNSQVIDAAGAAQVLAHLVCY